MKRRIIKEVAQFSIIIGAVLVVYLLDLSGPDAFLVGVITTIANVWIARGCR